MKLRILLLLVLCVVTMRAEFTRLIKLPHGAASTLTPCFSSDMNHDGYIEFGQWCQDEVPVFQGWQIWKCIPPDSFVLVKQEESSYPPPDPTLPGNLITWDVGDIDGDGRTELVGLNYGSPPPDYQLHLKSVESDDYYSLPSEINWMGAYSSPHEAYFSTPFRIAELDQDGKKDIIFVSYGLNVVLIYENVRNDSNRLVWTDTLTDKDYTLRCFVCADFDGDGLTEFMSGGIWGDYVVWENTGVDNEYQRVHTGAVSDCDARDVFGGRDIDGDGKPEFLISAFTTLPELWLYKGVGNNQYDSTLVGIVEWTTSSGKARSDVGDVDGDSLLEIVWSLRSRIILLDDFQHDYAELGEWTNDHYGNCDQSLVTCADLDLDGSDEVIVTGCFRTSILKWEDSVAVAEESPPQQQTLDLWVASTIAQTCTIHYTLPQPGRINLSVYDATGRMVETLKQAQESPGQHEVIWDASGVPSGVYFVRFAVSGKSTSCQVVIVR